MCIICGRQSKSDQIENSSCFLYDCPSCGRYGVTDVFLLDAQHIEPEIKTKISHLLAEHKFKKLNPILLASSSDGKVGNFVWTNYRDFLNNYPKEALEILDRSLLNLSRIVKHPSDKIRIDEKVKELFFSNDIFAALYIIRQLEIKGLQR